VTSGICELVVDNMDVDSSKGVVVGHACGEADANVFVLLLLSLCLHFCSFFTQLSKAFLSSCANKKSFVSISLVKAIKHIT